MSLHRSRRPTSSDSGYSSTTSTPSLDRTKDFDSSKSRDLQLEKVSLLSSATCSDLTSSIGTELSGIQLSNLNSQQLDDLALLVSERGVVFLKDQDLTEDDQIRISGHYGQVRHHIIERDQSHVKVKSSKSDHGEISIPVPGGWSDWVSDQSYEAKPPSFSIFKAASSGGDTVWVSQYALYDTLSKPVKRFVDELQVVHTSRLQYETICDFSGVPTERSPVETLHPAVRTHPITGLKALNVTRGATTAFEDLSRKESAKLLELLEHNMNSSSEHTVRFTWEAGSVAIWDNRCTAYKHIPTFPGSVAGTETRSVGEKPYFDPHSESRSERDQRIAREEAEKRIRIQEIEARFNNTPLRRILRRQACFSPIPQVNPSTQSPPQPDLSPRKQPQPQPQTQFKLRSNSSIRTHEEKIWTSTHPTSVTVPSKPGFKLRSNSQIRMVEREIWAKSDMSSSENVEGHDGDGEGAEKVEEREEEEGKIEVEKVRKRVVGMRSNGSGSPLRRIIQRQASGGGKVKR